jgi:hypothetical protein
LVFCFGHLGEVIGKADQAEGQRHEQDDPDVRVVKPRPEHGRKGQRRQDQEPAHRWRAGLDEMALWAVFADRLAFALPAAQQVDQRPAEHEAEDQGCKERGPCAEGDVAEQVEKITPVRKLGKPKQHSVRSLMTVGDRLPQFAQGVNDE